MKGSTSWSLFICAFLFGADYFTTFVILLMM